jgi:hypothetical protein
MWEFFEEIERAAEACKKAAANVKDSCFNVFTEASSFPEFQDALDRADFLEQRLEAIKPLAQEAVHAVDLVHERIVPRIEAIQTIESVHKIALELIAIRAALNRSEKLQSGITKQLTEGMGNQPPEQALRAFKVGLLLREVARGVAIGFLILPDLSRRLSAVAGTLKVKYHHTKPKEEPNRLVPQQIAGDLVMAKYTSNVTGSNVGALAVGDHAHAQGTVNVDRVSQVEHVDRVKAAQRALVNDQDALDQIDTRLYEALGQFLRLAREIQVEQKSIAEVQAKMKDTLDEVWGEQAAKGLRPRTLPKTLEVAKAMTENPVMVEVVKKLLES